MLLISRTENRRNNKNSRCGLCNSVSGEETCFFVIPQAAEGTCNLDEKRKGMLLACEVEKRLDSSQEPETQKRETETSRM